MASWGDGIPLPRPEARALDVLVGHFGGSMSRFLGDLYVSSTTPTAFRNLCDEGLVRKRLGSYEVTLAGRRMVSASRATQNTVKG